MITLGLSRAAREEWDRLKTMRYKCLVCGAEIQACGEPVYCECEDPATRIGVAGTVYVETLGAPPAASYEMVGR